jgi:hypothetical protein
MISSSIPEGNPSQRLQLIQIRISKDMNYEADYSGLEFS